MSSLEDIEKRLRDLEASHKNLEISVKRKFVDLDRKSQVGCLVLQGKNLPNFVRNEKLFNVVRELARKHLKVEIKESDVDYVRRISTRKNAPILIR